MYFTPAHNVKWIKSKTPRWFQKNWPLNGALERTFLPLDPRGGDEVEGGTSDLKVDFEKSELAVGYPGLVNDYCDWHHVHRQRLLAKVNGTWYLLFADADPNRIFGKGGLQISDYSNTGNCEVPLYLDLEHKEAESFVQSEFDWLHPGVDRKEHDQSKHGLTQAQKNLADLLIAWKVPPSEIWLDLINRFPELKKLVPYLYLKKQLLEDGSHPNHKQTASGESHSGTALAGNKGEQQQPQSRKERNEALEKQRQNAELESLKPRYRLYVFCGRIWRDLRDKYTIEDERILGGKTKTSAEVKMCFPIAIENGWDPKKTKLFDSYARTGIRKGKPWSDFVHGSKGKNIPLKKFLTGPSMTLLGFGEEFTDSE